MRFVDIQSFGLTIRAGRAFFGYLAGCIQIDAFIPFDSQPAEIFDDLANRIFLVTGSVGIFDPQHESAACLLSQ